MHRTLLLAAITLATTAPALADSVSTDASKPQTTRTSIHRFAQILKARAMEQLANASVPESALPHQSYVMDMLRSETQITPNVAPPAQAISANLDGGEG